MWSDIQDQHAQRSKHNALLDLQNATSTRQVKRWRGALYGWASAKVIVREDEKNLTGSELHLDKNLTCHS